MMRRSISLLVSRQQHFIPKSLLSTVPSNGNDILSASLYKKIRLQLRDAKLHNDFLPSFLLELSEFSITEKKNDQSSEKTLKVYNALIHTLCLEKGELSKACEILKSSHHLYELRPNFESFDIFIQSSLNRKEYDNIITSIDKMIKLEIIPNIETFNIALEVNSRFSNVEKAMKYLKLMETHNVKPNVFSFVHILTTCANRTKSPKKTYEVALQVLDSMERDHNIKPTFECYEATIRCFYNYGLKDEALDLFNKMQESGDIEVVKIAEFFREMRTTLIDRHVHIGDWKSASEEYNSLTNYKKLTNRKSYDNLLICYLKANKNQLAIQLFKDHNNTKKLAIGDMGNFRILKSCFQTSDFKLGIDFIGFLLSHNQLNFQLKLKHLDLLFRIILGAVQTKKLNKKKTLDFLNVMHKKTIIRHSFTNLTSIYLRLLEYEEPLENLHLLALKPTSKVDNMTIKDTDDFEPLKLFENLHLFALKPTLKVYNMTINVLCSKPFSNARLNDAITLFNQLTSSSSSGVVGGGGGRSGSGVHSEQKKEKGVTIRNDDCMVYLSPLLNSNHNNGVNTIKPDIFTFVPLLSGFERSKRYDELIELYKSMNEVFQVEHNTISHHFAIEAYGHMGHFDEAWTLYQSMKTKHMSTTSSSTSSSEVLNDITVTHMIRACGADYERAMEIFNSLEKELGIQPNKFIYSALLVVCERAGQGKLALELLQRAFDDDQEEPWSLSQVIRTLNKEEMYREAIELFNCRMIEGEKGGNTLFKPDVATVNSVLLAYKRLGEYHQALELFNALLSDTDKNRGASLKNNPTTFKSMINICSKDESLYEEGLNIYESMINKYYIAPDTSCLNALLGLHVKRGAYQEAIDYFEEMGLKHSSSIQYDVVSFNTILDACDKLGQWEKAFKLLTSMECDHGIQPNNISYNAVIGACQTAGQTDKAMELLALMEEKGIQPDRISFARVIRSQVD